MAIVKGGASSVKQPIEARASADYGLYVGPRGGFSKAGIQCKAPKWSNLFTCDEGNCPNLMNVLEYIESTASHEEWEAVMNGVDEFIHAFLRFKEGRQNAA